VPQTRRLTFSLDGFWSSAPYLIPFLYLQMLDFLTTVVAVKIGFAEVSPFVRWLMRSNLAIGLLESKVVALGLAMFCIWSNRGFLVRWINRWYAALVVWNLVLMWIANPGPVS
jgi:hypothetical protein